MTEDAKKSTDANTPSPWTLVGLAGQIGYIIAIPAVLFGFGGAYLDKRLCTSPAFVLLGLSLALTSSMFGVWRIIRQVMDASAPKEPSDDAQVPKA